MPAQVKWRWRNKEFLKGLNEEITRRMLAVESLAVQAYQANVGTPYPPASLPGQFPHRRSGTLQRGIRTNVNRVGNTAQLTLTNRVRYAGFLEHGTSKMAARPHLKPTGQQVFRMVKRALRAE